MPSLEASVTVPLPRARVYHYLRGRYEMPTFKYAALEAKGYMPRIERVVDDEPRKLVFWVRGRDGLLKFPIGGWRWSYDLASASGSETKVTIRYEWSWLMCLLTAWTVRLQAANELVETARALEALAQGAEDDAALPPPPVREA